MRSIRFATAALLLTAPAIAAQAPATKPTLSAATREFVSVDAPIVALTHVKLIDGINHMGIVAAPKAVSLIADDVATRAMAGS